MSIWVSSCLHRGGNTMTWFYKCLNCQKILGFGKDGKGGINLIRVHGECCYDFKEEAENINQWRLDQGSDEMSLYPESSQNGEGEKNA